LIADETATRGNLTGEVNSARKTQNLFQKRYSKRIMKEWRPLQAETLIHANSLRFKNAALFVSTNSIQEIS
jgi:hypothetical protein